MPEQRQHASLHLEEDDTFLRLDGGDPEAVTLPRLAARVQALQGGGAEVPVIISGDRRVRYEAVMKVMATLQKERIARVGLMVKQGE